MAKLKHSPTIKILIVDDDRDTRSLLQVILEEEGYDVIQAADGVEALERVKEDMVDLIITDRAMPNMDGMALMAVLREKHAGVPVMMISAYGEEAFWSQAIGLGAVDYILKPFKAEEVLKSVHKVFREGKKK